MIRTVLLLGLVASLSACGDGQPLFDGDTDGETPTAPVDRNPAPEDIAGSLTDARFVPPSGGNPNGALTVEVSSLDSTPTAVRYRPTPELNMDGYSAYSVQEDPLDRYFLALARTSRDRSVSGTVVADGGQFGRYFGGVDYGRNAPYSPYQPTQPDRGLVSYAGSYAGLLNVNATRNLDLETAPPGTNPALLPGQPSRVQGDVFLNADFTDNSVNGAITDRRVLDQGVAVPLENVNLIVTNFTPNGHFEGVAELPGDEAAAIGVYSGLFGGNGATSVAGGTYFQDFIEEVDNEEERGLFVLNRCGLAGDAAICDDVNPRR